MSHDVLPTAVVTGAGAGIGRAIATRLGHDGYAVVVVDRVADGAHETAALMQEEGLTASAEVLDICEPAATHELLRKQRDFQVLVNNAGLFDVIEFDALTPDDFRRMYEVNLVAMFSLCQQASSVLPAGGRIVNLASRAAFGARKYAHYVASKAGVIGFTKALALELAPKGITVNAVAPGVIETTMLKARNEGLDALRAEQPMGQLGSPEHIAHAVAFLVDPRANYVTGQVVIVDGGRSLGGTASF